MGHGRRDVIRKFRLVESYPRGPAHMVNPRNVRIELAEWASFKRERCKSEMNFAEPRDKVKRQSFGIPKLTIGRLMGASLRNLLFLNAVSALQPRGMA